MNTRRRKGSAVVELALIILLYLAMIFAIIDYSLFLFVRNTLQHAVREGVRYAVTYQTMSGMGQDASIKTIVQQNAAGLLSGSRSSYIVINYYTPDTLASTSSNSPGNIVEVSVQNYQWGWMAPLWRTAGRIGIYVYGMDRMESTAGGSTPPAR